MSEKTPPSLARFQSNTGVTIYRIPLEAFPNFNVYAYLLLDGERITLVDCGSNMDKSQADLLKGFQAIRDDFSEKVRLEEVSQILITHGHIDHHGGLNFVHQHTQAPVGIHPLDRRILTAYEERVVVATKNLRVYLQRAGVNEETISHLMDMYGFSKRLLKSEQVSFLLEEGVDHQGMRFYHVPGHCPGQVCIQIGDVMLTADHILSRITPHQAPESITHFTGLGHYLDSLNKIKTVEGIRLALGGHEDPIFDLYGRVEAIKADHQQKLDRVREVIAASPDPLTVSDISKHMYPNMKSYGILLALEEVGAHVEYLYERGLLAISNLHEVEQEDNPALRYCVV
jgi:glyoxylase-like metal-dependent hydrolase (beta-lactamase superfamily II)